jgi:hypothetical protein
MRGGKRPKTKIKTSKLAKFATTQLIRDQLDALGAWSNRIADMATKARTIQNSGRMIEECATDLMADLDLRIAAVPAALRAV